MCPYYEDNINLITFHLFKPQTKYTGEETNKKDGSVFMKMNVIVLTFTISTSASL